MTCTHGADCLDHPTVGMPHNYDTDSLRAEVAALRADLQPLRDMAQLGERYNGIGPELVARIEARLTRIEGGDRPAKATTLPPFPATDFDYTTLSCPMGGCDEPLYLTWEASYPLSVGDLTDPDVPQMSGGHAETWKVECVAGHVLLLPGRPGCGCDDPEGPDCSCDQDQFDQSEESSRFRAHDLERLRETLRALGGAL